jgi:hypothetical protein
VTRNLVHGNHVGIYAVDSGRFDDNVTWDNTFFDMTFQDGSFTPARDRLGAPGGGVAVVASHVDSDAALTHARFFGTSGPLIQTFGCCGFTATGRLSPWRLRRAPEGGRDPTAAARVRFVGDQQARAVEHEEIPRTTSEWQRKGR